MKISSRDIPSKNLVKCHCNWWLFFTPQWPYVKLTWCISLHLTLRTKRICPLEAPHFIHLRRWTLNLVICLEYGTITKQSSLTEQLIRWFVYTRNNPLQNQLHSTSPSYDTDRIHCTDQNPAAADSAVCKDVNSQVYGINVLNVTLFALYNTLTFLET